MLITARVVLGIVAALRSIGAQRLGGKRAFSRNACTAQDVCGRPDDGAHLQKTRIFLQQCQAHPTGVGQPLQLLADRLEHTIEVVFLQQQRAQPLQANHLFQPTLQLAIQPGIVEADRRLVGERRQQFNLARVKRGRLMRKRRERAERPPAGAQWQDQLALTRLKVAVVRGGSDDLT